MSNNLIYLNMKKLSLSIFFLLVAFNFSFSQSKYFTGAKYIQGNDYKSTVLSGYGTDFNGGLNAPKLILNKFDEGSTNLYLREAFEFTKDNSSITIIFPKEKKNNNWKISYSSFGCQDEEFEEYYDCIFIGELENISTGEVITGATAIANKFIKAEHLIFKIIDKTGFFDNNVCSFEIKRFQRKKLNKVISDKYKSKEAELLN